MSDDRGNRTHKYDPRPATAAERIEALARQRDDARRERDGATEAAMAWRTLAWTAAATGPIAVAIVSALTLAAPSVAGWCWLGGWAGAAATLIGLYLWTARKHP